MNKSDFIKRVAEKAELSTSAAARVVEAIFDAAEGAISEAVHAAGSLSIPGFGKFTRKTRPARAGRNPRTGAEIDIPERTSVGFSAGKNLKTRTPSGRRRTTAAAGGASATGASRGGARKTAGAGGSAGGGARKAAAGGGGSTGARKTAPAGGARKAATADTGARKTAAGGTSGARKSAGGGSAAPAAKKTASAPAKKASAPAKKGTSRPGK